MFGEGKVQTKFTQLAKDFNFGWSAPVRQHGGAGDRTITYTVGSAYCTADWWDRGFRFTLFLGRRFEVGGRSFVAEFPVEAFEEGKRPIIDRRDIEDQIDDQFKILHWYGRSWLSGDFSGEPFIRHQVRPSREEERTDPVQQPDLKRSTLGSSEQQANTHG